MKGRKAQAPPRVMMERITAPDASERLRWAFNLILRAAARAGEQAETRQNDGQEVKNDEH